MSRKNDVICDVEIKVSKEISEERRFNIMNSVAEAVKGALKSFNLEVTQNVGVVACDKSDLVIE